MTMNCRIYKTLHIVDPVREDALLKNSYFPHLFILSVIERTSFYPGLVFAGIVSIRKRRETLIRLLTGLSNVCLDQVGAHSGVAR